MNVERLKNLIVSLRDAKPEDFSMLRYGNMCGTPACVLGHYASRTDLQGSFVLQSREGDCHPYVYSIDDDGPADCYSEYVTDHFDIDEEQALELFADNGCGNASTPEQAIEYIEEFIRREAPATSQESDES